MPRSNKLGASSYFKPTEADMDLKNAPKDAYNAIKNMIMPSAPQPGEGLRDGFDQQSGQVYDNALVALQARQRQANMEALQRIQQGNTSLTDPSDRDMEIDRLKKQLGVK